MNQFFRSFAGHTRFRPWLIGLAVAALSWLPPRLSPAQVRIMPLGNSITQGNNTSDSYRRRLWKKLQTGGYNVNFVGSMRAHYGGNAPVQDFDLDHEGHWGWRADQLLAQAQGWATSAAPDVVLLHAGSNDLIQNQNLNDTRDEIGQIIDRLRLANPNVKVLLAQLIPTTWSNGSANTRIPQLNALLPALASSKTTAQSPVTIVDQFTGFNAATDTYDGVHPNATGEEKMASVWYAALRAVLPTPLPVTLTHFSAQAVHEGVRLSWQTATEKNNAHFTPERSLDGHEFRPLRDVAGHGTSATPRSYAFVDEAAPKTGHLYYRLKQTDFDGTTAYSPTVVVRHEADDQGLRLFPVPAQNKLRLSGLPADHEPVRIYDLRGRLWLRRAATGSTPVLEVSSLPPGVYVLRVGTQARRFVKQ